ncbi:SDR family oxidoreductase [Oceanobacillus sp. CAU 1775]
MKHTIFITGYPGFLARNFIRQLFEDHEKDLKQIYLLVLPHEEVTASRELEYFIKSNALKPEQFTLLTGDITKEHLAIDPAVLPVLNETVTHVFHFAAVYDLAVKEEIAYQVNVIGTKNVNEWVRKLKNLERYIYFSTAYVSGKREGKIYETDLEANQSFKNHYEATKFEAEIYVEALKPTVPITIIRPGIVKGDSVTGHTIKFDGLYFLLNLLDSLSSSPVIPYLGKGDVEGNFVPSDYVLKATSYLSFSPKGTGKTYHLTDPNPYTMRELYKMFSEAYLGRTPKGELPLSLASLPMQSKTVQRLLQVEQEALDYFIYDTAYDSSQAQKDLAESGIRCPDLKETIEPMIEFYRKYKHDYAKHITI